MSRLSDILSGAIMDAMEHGGFEHRKLAERLYPELDDGSKRMLGIAGLAARAKETAKNLTKSMAKESQSDQYSLLFDIDAAVAIDLDGGRIRATRTLTEHEFNRAIEIRRAQIEHDRASLAEWRSAAAMARPYWRAHPDWTYGQCVEAFIRDTQAEAAE